MLPSFLPNQTYQADLVGPCYLKGPVRFYSLSVVDTATVVCGLNPTFPVPPELKLEYVVATINVKEEKLKLFLDKTQIEEFDYKLR